MTNDDKNIRVWDLSTGKVKWNFDGLPGPLGNMAFSPDGRALAGHRAGVRIFKRPRFCA